MQGLIGRKLGMTQVYDGNGAQVAVTVLEVGPCVVVQRKTKSKDGYDAVQLGFSDQKESRVSKPALERFKKAGTTAKRILREFSLDAGEDPKAGDTATAAVFKGVGFVDVSGWTKGKGYQGVVRRHHFKGGPAAHGHTAHRRTGAIGQRERPGRVKKLQRMPGQMGHVYVTTQSLRVVDVREDQNLLLVGGAVAGPTGAMVVVTRALKKTGKAQ